MKPVDGERKMKKEPVERMKTERTISIGLPDAMNQKHTRRAGSHV